MLPASPFLEVSPTGGVLRAMRKGTAVSPGKAPNTLRWLHASPQYPDRKTLLPLSAKGSQLDRLSWGLALRAGTAATHQLLS